MMPGYKEFLPLRLGDSKQDIDRLYRLVLHLYDVLDRYAIFSVPVQGESKSYTATNPDELAWIEG